MALFSRWLGRKSDISNVPQPEHRASGNADEGRFLPAAIEPMIVTAELLKQLFPIRTLEDEVLKAFAHQRPAEAYGAGTELFRRGEPVDSVFYLLKGVVRLESGDNKSIELNAATAKARFPLSSGKQHGASAFAVTDIQVLRVSPRIMHQPVANDTAVRLLLDPGADGIPENVRSNLLFRAFCQHFRDEELQLPSMPEVAVKFRQALNHDVSLNEVIGIVQMDPAIAAKLVRVANSPLYAPIKPINNCLDAVNRLGLIATCNLVVGYSLKQIFRSKNPDIGQLMMKEWKNSIYLSSLCWVLACENPEINAEEAQLAGLIADIGVVPLLNFAESFPPELWNLEDLKLIIPYAKAPAGSYLLERMDFSPELVEIPRLSEMWLLDRQAELTLADIVILSKLHACIGQHKMADVPIINSIPACGKIRDGRLSPEYSLNVLHEAKDRVGQLLKLFEA